ncbi:MAG: YopX family protein [Oenococcus oeni]
MTRPIKFRVWDDKTKKYLTERDAMKYLDTGWTCVETNTGIATEFYDFEDNGRAIEQYTGINDKNGVEIYENDIVLGKDGTELIVMYVNGFLSLLPKDEEDAYPIKPLLFPTLNFPIIGNIHEGVKK